MERVNAWNRWDPVTRTRAEKFCREYRQAISAAKTERSFVARCVEAARRQGFREFGEIRECSAGQKIYVVNRAKHAIFGILGKHPLEEGCRFVAAHVDSPRLDLKTTPLYEDEGIAFFKTYYYGGIKKYQWLTIPLALHGVVVLKDGKTVRIEIGESPEDPVFTIPDLLPHLARDQGKKTIDEGFPAENLNILAGSIRAADGKDQKTKKHMLALLRTRYGISEDDLTSAEIQAVPAGPAREAGIDRSMILGYGQDDRACAYAAFQALLDAGKVQRSCFCVLADQEEIGSYGSTSARSAFFRYFLEDLLERSCSGNGRIRDLLRRSCAISGDVHSLLDPNFKEAFDPRNSARLGCGVVLCKTTGGRGKSMSTEPSAEFLARIRDTFDKNRVVWQPGELGKVEQGGGGTVATYLACLDIDTVDCGTGVLSTHAPFELASKADLYTTYQAYAAFYAEG